MSKRMITLLALAISLFGTQCWAQEPVPCTSNSGISCTFSPTQTTNTYDFSATGDGKLVVSFVTVLTTFTLTATVNHTIDPLDPNEFPAGTVCVPYSSNGGRCDEYDFSGSSGGPNGVPVRNTDYKGLINLTLSYFYTGPVHDPAFGHAPGDNATAVYSEDILTGYSIFPTGCGCEDPTMDGTLPGLSAVTALDKPFVEIGDTFCSLTVTPTNNASGQKSEEEVTLKIVSGSDCSGTGIRDKTARLSVSDSNGNVVLKNVEGNKFHWDNKNGLNEYDISTEGLVSGQTYTVTVFSGKVSPHITTFVAP